MSFLFWIELCVCSCQQIPWRDKNPEINPIACLVCVVELCCSPETNINTSMPHTAAVSEGDSFITTNMSTALSFDSFQQAQSCCSLYSLLTYWPGVWS